jgi:hypothetical protein
MTKEKMARLGAIRYLVACCTIAGKRSIISDDAKMETTMNALRSIGVSEIEIIEMMGIKDFDPYFAAMHERGSEDRRNDVIN